mgnify:FL=1
MSIILIRVLTDNISKYYIRYKTQYHVEFDYEYQHVTN